MIAAIVDGDQTCLAAFGQANPGETGAPVPNSLLRLNSLSKLMTGEILAALQMQGRIALDSPLQAFAPRHRIVPVLARSRAITVRDLVIHTSGLARDLPSSLSQVSLGERWNWLENVRPLRAPGRATQYSNAAYMFLGDALVRASGTGYATLLATHVTTPLGLHDTTLSPNKEQCARLMNGGHSDDRACSPAFETAATSGVYSTASDIAIWMHAVLDAPAGSPRALSRQPLVRRAQLPRLIAMDMAGRTGAIGYAWLHMKLNGLPVIQKTGGGGGFMNYVILAPSRRLGIFITVTRTDMEMLRRIAADTNALMITLAHDSR